ncbi:MAG: 3-hydroxyacyl-CoA dehydrogenase NAD-binding domain-containing protein [Chloroflexales bacterium]|nr:3-hydroxyacyl-CoA dehydrogenase NAD-binding domain-containing protein [Chloroflexales bacterium]
MISETIAVLGSGTMGAGIVQVVLFAGLPVVLYDVSAEILDRAHERIAAGLSKQGRPDAIQQLRTTTTLDEIAGAALVIEAVPENMDLKRDLFAKVGALCPAPAIIASNTSSLPIAALAAACPQPQRVAGLHFFNPVHRMALVEVIRTPQTDEPTVASLLAFAERLGKTPALARDTPGFIVNRVARPFYGESLRLLGENVARAATIDTVVQKAGGFPLGPFALMDLIGIDVNFAVTQSVYAQSFNEPRYRPHLIQQQMVLQNTLGRKTGKGFYNYGGQQDAARSETQTPPRIAGSVICSSGTWAPGLADLCGAAGLRLIEELPSPLPEDLRAAFVVAGKDEGAVDLVLTLERMLPDEMPIFVQCADIMACELASLMIYPARLVGFDGMFMNGAITLVATPLLSEETRATATVLVQSLEREPVWIADAAALIVPRIVAMLANEAAFAVGEGVAEPDAIDTAMWLGTNHPVGPLARAADLGYARMVAILDHLRTEYGDERYRVAPALRRAARVGRLG